MKFQSLTSTNTRLICLCPKCRQDYETAGFRVRKVQIYQIDMDVCTKCNYRSGLDYSVSATIKKEKSADRDQGGV